jgi:NTE family protein
VPSALSPFTWKILPALLLLAGPAAAECRGPNADASSGRPRVGLVLSGGGARGLAHIGLLEVIEREGLRVDCVAGTSMGAAIGALWASGYSARAIAETARSLDWQQVFSGRRIRSLVPLALRIDDVPPLLRVGMHGLTPRLPASQASDYRLNRLLFRLLAAPALAAGHDFDRLPRPFRTVATDLATGERVVLDRGSLARAVRASMSTPITLPVTFLDGRQLVDGGFIDNVPVDVARAMGADVVIVSDASAPPQEPDEYEEVYGIGRQVLDILGRGQQTSRAQDGDVVVRPELGRHKWSDYSDPDALIAAGREAARAALPTLRTLAGGPTAVAAGPTAPAQRAVVRSVVVRGAGHVSERTVRAAFGLAVGDAFDPQRAIQGLDRLWALGLFETAWIDAESEAGGVRLVVEVRESPRLFLELGGAANEADQIAGFVRLRARNAFGHAERAEVELAGGIHDYGVRAGLTAGGLAFGRWPVGLFARGLAMKEEPRFFIEGDAFGRAKFDRALVDGGLHVGVGPDVLLQAGLAAGRVEVERRPVLGLPGAADAYRVLHGTLAWDRLDDQDLPLAGVALAIRGERSLTGLGASRDYWRARATARGAVGLGGSFAIEGTALLGLSGRDVPVYDLFRIGGPDFLPGRPRDELWARQVLGLSVAPSVDVRGFRIAIHGGLGNAWTDRSSLSLSDLRGGAGLRVTRRSGLGLLSLGAGVDDSGHAAFYFSIGRRPGAGRP